MSVPWYYSHDGTTHGPYSEEEIQARVNRGLLLKSDRIWPAGKEPKDAAPAFAVLDFSQAVEPASLPDWLADVAAVEQKGPAPGPLPSEEIPDWLEDFRLWVALEVGMPVAQASQGSAAENAASSSEAPDWLETWTTLQLRSACQPEPSVSTVPAPAIPAEAPKTAPPAVKTEMTSAAPPPGPTPPTAVARLTEKVAGVGEASTAPPSVRPEVKAQPPVEAPAPLREAAPAIENMPAPVEPKPASLKPANPLVEKTLQASGFDLETGQILDAEKFRKWRQQQAQSSTGSQSPFSNASVLEVFRKARTAIEGWIDDDGNRSYVMNAKMDEIKSRPEIQAILQEYGVYGQAMQEKLLRHLEFMVENRRKYYLAVAGRPQ